ncbi:site-specific integrase [Scatolibacter rhodanostii]|uniref:site-specific integrase n=1 Tax=Scatolibacter rhodanostii TaxID=2014781 RepID=UPI000C0726A1|nr:site-specific integrase [Scatolibacter rhodanostii]
MAKIRKDHEGHILQKGECQRKDGSYVYFYTCNGKRKYLYDTDLLCLRTKENKITKDIKDAIKEHPVIGKGRKDRKGRNLHKGECQRKDGYYVYFYTCNGKRKYVYDKDLASLRIKEKQIIKDLEDGIRTQESMGITLNDMFHTYMQTKTSLKESTRANYMYLWQQYIQHAPFANCPLPSIRKSDILLFYSKLLETGFAINSLEGINNLIHPTLELAVDDDLIRKNPSQGVYHSFSRNNTTPPRIALTLDQEQKFLEFIKGSPTYRHWLPVFVTLLGTGMRVSECTGLTWSDVDFEANTLSVNHSLIYRVIDGHAGFHISTPKTKNSTRIIPLIPKVAKALHLLHEELSRVSTDSELSLAGYHGFVFRNRFGSFLGAHAINRAIDPICKEINLEETEQAKTEKRKPRLLPHFSVHNLRHTFCTRLCETTTDIAVIQQIMGHADIATTLEQYNHVSQEHIKIIMGNIINDLSLM